MTYESVRVAAIKEKAREVSAAFASRHNPEIVNNFVQISLGAASLQSLFGEEVDMPLNIRWGAKLSSQGNQQRAETIQRDEELCMRVLVAEQELRARGQRD